MRKASGELQTPSVLPGKGVCVTLVGEADWNRESFLSMKSRVDSSVQFSGRSD